MLDRFDSLVSSDPDATALIDAASGAVTTRAMLLARAREIAQAVREASSSRLVAAQLPNSTDFVATFLATLAEGMLFMPLDRDAPQEELARIVDTFGAGAIVSSSSSQLQIASTRSGRVLPLPDDARLLKLTSGSTGQPKAVVMSEQNLLADCLNICSTMGITAEDINFGAIPFSHSYGFSNLVTPLIVQGTAIVVSNEYVPQSVLDSCNRLGCTVLPGIPMLFEHLVQAAAGDFSTLRLAISAGAVLPRATALRFRERFGQPIHTFYGCSECGGITYDREGTAAARGAAGLPLDGVTLTLNDSRLGVQSAALALGIFEPGSGFIPIEPDRFQTDDLATRNADGEVILTGRASEIINTAGKKVNPREVEQMILQISGVRDARVFGQEAGARGQIVAAAVVADPDVTREQIRAHCGEHLARHKVPRVIKFLQAIPVDERGKVRRAALMSLSQVTAAPGSSRA